jgi:hypothetical protein
MSPARALVNRLIEPESYQDLISLIVENNPVDVRANLTRATNRNYAGYSNADIVKEIMKLYANGNNISEIVNVRVIDAQKNFPEYFEKYENAKFDLSKLNFGQIVLGLVSGITGGSILGNVLFGGNNSQPPTSPPPPPPTPPKEETFLQKHGKKLMIVGGIVVLVIVLYFAFKSKKKG